MLPRVGGGESQLAYAKEMCRVDPYDSQILGLDRCRDGHNRLRPFHTPVLVRAYGVKRHVGKLVEERTDCADIAHRKISTSTISKDFPACHGPQVSFFGLPGHR